LDVGVGLGNVLKPLKHLERHGIDVSMGYLKVARASGIEVAFSRIEDMPYADGAFDAVVATDVLEHVISLDACLVQIIRVLKPGGRLILRVPNQECLDGYLEPDQPQYCHLRTFDLAGLRLALEKSHGLAFLEGEGCGYVFGHVEQLRIRLPSVKGQLREVVSGLPADLRELDVLRRALDSTEEELVDSLLSLRRTSPESYQKLMPHVMKPVEVSAVFEKPRELSWPRQQARPAAVPVQGHGKLARRYEELLLICYYDPAGISAVPELIANLQKQSQFSVTVLNLFEHRVDSEFLKLRPSVNLAKYAGIVVHNSVSYNVDNLRSLDSQLSIKFKDFAGAKILLKQDENFRFLEVDDYVTEAGYDLIFTCLPDEAIKHIYPRSAASGKSRFARMLTGYVTPTLRAQNWRVEGRPIDIGYRGSIQPLSFGRLAYEKRKIGYDVARRLRGRGLRLDVSSRWEDRISGDAWLAFLRSCKATLGVESGASIFDLHNNLEARCRQAERKLGPFSESEEYAEAYLAELADLEGGISYNQVSPRHFEAAATGTLQLLYPGNYSGVFRAGDHYFSLERDGSNLDDALELLCDERRRGRITERAFAEVIENRANWIETFVARFDGETLEVMQKKGACRSPQRSSKSAARNVVLLAAHDPAIDPRLAWISEHAPPGLRIHLQGVLPPETPLPLFAARPEGSLCAATPRRKFSPGFLESLYPAILRSSAGMAALAELQVIERLLQLPDDTFCEALGAPIGCERVTIFRWYLQYILDTSMTLIESVLQARGVGALIATDLDTLAAALVLKGALGVPVVYDAHEFWSQADPSGFEFERQFWTGMEQRLVPHADRRQTVSPGLARIMADLYSCDFQIVPNCEPAGSIRPGLDRRLGSSNCKFLFQGNFATARGIDLLIEAWPATRDEAHLLLRGPDSAYKRAMEEVAARTGLLGRRIFFPTPVAEGELVSAAAQADVGLIPYTPTGLNYAHCCPNKMSQYMAAGIPILANDTSFVAETLRVARCGTTVDFTRTQALIDAVNALASGPDQRRLLGRNGLEYFRQFFHWEIVSRPLYDGLRTLLTDAPVTALTLFAPDNRPHVSTERLAFYGARSDRISATHKPLGWAFRSAQAVWIALPASARSRFRPLARSVKRLLQP
jgi:glycosyltransferase involved in cell wall biosynthesis